MYIKFKVENIEIELGGFDNTFDVKPLVNDTVNAVTDIFLTGKVKELRDAIERLEEDDDYGSNDTVSCNSYNYVKTSFRTIENAQTILNEMRSAIKQNGYCSVANYNMLIGLKADQEDFNYGWTNLDYASVERKQFDPLADRSYYLSPYKLVLPNPVKITKKQTEVYE